MIRAMEELVITESGKESLLLKELSGKWVKKEEMEERIWRIDDMRLELVQKALKEKRISYQYAEEDGCGSIDFFFRGIPYHVWEFEDDGWGVETNIENSGKSEDIFGNYEEKVADVIWGWPEMIQP